MVEKQTAVDFIFFFLSGVVRLILFPRAWFFLPGSEKKNPFCKCEIGNNARCKIAVNDKAWLAGMGHTLFLITW